MLQRVFYVTQGSLSVWQPEAADRAPLRFPDTDSGLRDFDRYLAANPDTRSAMLVDVIEEEFALDSIPKLGARDRAALIQRRGQRKFRRTPYRVSIYHGTKLKSDKEFSVVHSAISNHELIDPWMQLILQHRTPIAGVYSVPLMAPATIKKLFDCSGAVMFIAPHQGNKLRQVFMRDGAIHSARLSQGPGLNEEGFAQHLVTEVIRSRRYLERTRLLAGMESLTVCVVAESDCADQVRALIDANSAEVFRFLTPQAAAKKLGRRPLRTADHFEEVFLAAVAKRLPKQNYATSGENRYWSMRRIRNAVIGTSFVAATACSIVAAILFSDVWILRNRIDAIQLQVDHLAETFRRENDRFDPIKADSHEMQLAVDTGDYLLTNRVPVPWVMNQLGAVLGDYPDIRMQQLRWLAETPQVENGRPQRRGDATPPLTVHETIGVTAVLTAHIEPFDGDMRHAFARIDELAADIESRTLFNRVNTLEYPFNASTSAAVSGEIVNVQNSAIAQFRLRVSYDLQGSATAAGEADESI
tara:strand:- start:9994 stop:11577 length:1584 start_codon:yes stop_codon:yes gene_type:complete